MYCTINYQKSFNMHKLVPYKIYKRDEIGICNENDN